MRRGSLPRSRAGSRSHPLPLVKVGRAMGSIETRRRSPRDANGARLTLTCRSTPSSTSRGTPHKAARPRPCGRPGPAHDTRLSIRHGALTEAVTGKMQRDANADADPRRRLPADDRRGPKGEAVADLPCLRRCGEQDGSGDAFGVACPSRRPTVAASCGGYRCPARRRSRPEPWRNLSRGSWAAVGRPAV
jgi:hypothetical protein